jgi:hypothetical protein
MTIQNDFLGPEQSLAGLDPGRPHYLDPLEIFSDETNPDDDDRGPGEESGPRELAGKRHSKVIRESLEPLPVIRKWDASPERGAALLLTAFGCLIVALSWIYIFVHQTTVSDAIIWVMLGLYVFVVIGTFGMILWYGLKMIELPEALIKTLAVSTICEVAALILVIVKHFFSHG